MKKLSTQKLTLIAMFIALTALATMVIQIPIPATKGYLNIGDTLLICAGLLLGKTVGGIVGGIGSALADILSGYAFYAPITLVVKGLEGYVAGALNEKTKLPRSSPPLWQASSWRWDISWQKASYFIISPLHWQALFPIFYKVSPAPSSLPSSIPYCKKHLF